MLVKIIKVRDSNRWYRKCVGHTFNVYGDKGDMPVMHNYYIVKSGVHHARSIHMMDCVKVLDPNIKIPRRIRCL